MYTLDWERVARAETHPIRIQILEALASEGGRAVSPSQLAREIGCEVNNLSYHFRELLGNELIEVADTRPVRGAMETIYRLVEGE
ncbi:MAG TPA: helix-turn-helix domain-containing protein [Solirubrobacterales bacterium]|nr:helix-turn-helix domain-containing protein [Solirubrobacterales bacterium]